MKYGLIVYSGDHGGLTARNANGHFNVGDNIQMLAIKYIYKEKMKISENDIVEIDFHDLETYDGEYVILPINLFFFGCSDAKERWFPASPKIIPVFIGVHFSSDRLSKEEVDYLRMYAPIGCRDEYTLNTMRRYHIPAYLFGCITAIFPRRPVSPKAGKVYIVDVEAEALAYMPESLQNRVKYTYHEDEGRFSEEIFREMDLKAYNLLKEYYQNASLVVTSRLHCASPCIAMGIPTIMVVKERSSRFAWIDKLIPIYTSDDYSKIEWFPSSVDYEPIKQKMIDAVIMRLQAAKKFWEPIYDISMFFENRTRVEYIDPNQKMMESIDKYIFKTGYEEYIIWGATAQAEQAYQHINHKYPHAKFVSMIDEYNRVNFHGQQAVCSSESSKLRDASIIVTPTSAKAEIKEQLKRLGCSAPCVFYDGEVLNP